MIFGTLRKQSPQTGFSLVEVLIALVIMSIGMLGIAGLYVQSMQAGRTSMFRHHAVTLAGDVADRIRANPTAGIAYDHVATDLGTNGMCVANGIDCDAATMAGHDIFLWQAQALTSLPRGRVSVAFTAGVGATPPSYLITIAWDEPGDTPTYVINIPVLAI